MPFSLSGRYAAFAEYRASESGGAWGAAIVRRDLKTGALIRDDHPSRMPGDPPDSPVSGDDHAVTGLILRPTGALAWIVADYSWHPFPDRSCNRVELRPCRVLKADRDGRAVLDEGTNIEPQSLSLNGSTVTWLSNGQQLSANLR